RRRELGIHLVEQLVGQRVVLDVQRPELVTDELHAGLGGREGAAGAALAVADLRSEREGGVEADGEGTEENEVEHCQRCRNAAPGPLARPAAGGLRRRMAPG